MHGAKGSRLRARLILAEFALGAAAGPALGAVVVVQGGSPAWQLFGLWIAGACLNYVPLVIYAIELSDREALASELADADIPSELRRYTKAQVWVFVPLALIVFDRRQRHARTASRQAAED